MKLTKEQAIIISGYTGFMACKFSDFHCDAEKRLGRPIFTHEFVSQGMREQIENLYRADFIAMCLTEPTK